MSGRVAEDQSNTGPAFPAQLHDAAELLRQRDHKLKPQRSCVFDIDPGWKLDAIVGDRELPEASGRLVEVDLDEALPLIRETGAAF